MYHHEAEKTRSATYNSTMLIDVSLPRLHFRYYLSVDAKKRAVNLKLFREKKAHRNTFHGQILVMTASLLCQSKDKSFENAFQMLNIQK